MIDYNIVDQAIKYYKHHYFRYLEVPWVVTPEIMNITRPLTADPVLADTMVASGEQSLLSEILGGKIGYAQYCCATPCYRPYDNQNDGIHFTQFFKVELMECAKTEPTRDKLRGFISFAKVFMDRYFPYGSLQIVETKDDLRFGCETLVSYDIQTKEGVELGSYGIRRLFSRPDFYWMYGTGAAMPRLRVKNV